MATHHELQTVRVRCERVDVIIHRQAHPIQSLNDHTRRTIIHNKIRKFNGIPISLFSFANAGVISGFHDALPYFVDRKAVRSQIVELT